MTSSVASSKTEVSDRVSREIQDDDVDSAANSSIITKTHIATNAADMIHSLEKVLAGVRGLSALDIIKTTDYWKGRAIDAINKNKDLTEENQSILEKNQEKEREVETWKKEVETWKRRVVRAEKRVEKVQAELALTTVGMTTAGISNRGTTVTAEEIAEVTVNPSRDLQHMMGSSFRKKWSRRRVSGIDDQEDADAGSAGESTTAARKYVNEYITSQKGKKVQYIISTDDQRDDFDPHMMMEV